MVPMVSALEGSTVHFISSASIAILSVALISRNIVRVVQAIIVNRLYVHEYIHYFSASIAFGHDGTWRGQPLLGQMAVDLFFLSLLICIQVQL